MYTRRTMLILITIKPIPEPPPVTRATLPLTSKTLLSWKLEFDILITIRKFCCSSVEKRGGREYLFISLFMEVASDVLVTIAAGNWWGHDDQRSRPSQIGLASVPQV